MSNDYRPQRNIPALTRQQLARAEQAVTARRPLTVWQRAQASAATLSADPKIRDRARRVLARDNRS